MKRLLCLALAGACAFAAFTVTGGDWRTLARPVVRLVVDDGLGDYLSGGEGVRVTIDDRYEMQFPAEPERKTQSLEIKEEGITTEAVSYLVEGDDLAYLVEYFDLPVLLELDTAGREDVMKHAAMTLNQGAFSGRVLTWTPRPERGDLEFTVAVDEGGFIKARTFIEVERMYLMAVEDDRNPPRTYERFTHSAKPRQPGPG